MRTDPVLERPVVKRTVSAPTPLEIFLPERLAVTDFSPEENYFSFDSLPPFPHPLRHPIRAANWIVQLLFGLASLFLMLVVLSAIPLLNFLALGYLLEQLTDGVLPARRDPICPMDAAVGQPVGECLRWLLGLLPRRHHQHAQRPARVDAPPCLHDLAGRARPPHAQ